MPVQHTAPLRLVSPMPAPLYNYHHFRAAQFRADAARTRHGTGIPPGMLAPNFELPLAGGGTVRLADLRGEVVLLHFGSFT